MLNFQSVRDQTLEICSGLETEDFVVQPHEFISPPKWHLGHTTWFFEVFCLQEFFDAPLYNRSFHFIFNSYYEALGDHAPQGQRGALSRPTVREVLAYRRHVDQLMIEAENNIKECSPEVQAKWKEVTELGLHHEQQHQELLYMDIKHIFSHQIEPPILAGAPLETAATGPRAWIEVKGGVYDIGWTKSEFSYDNERPSHREYVPDFAIRTDLVSNSEFLEFIADGGYSRPELWLADGWNWIGSSRVQAPLYWKKSGVAYTLRGEAPVHFTAPVSHISYYEAEAFARWKKCRLPTEAEWETALGAGGKSALWQWTASAYLPYPGFSAFAGAAQEYNGKFMSGQMVLRGGSLMTPDSHYRPTYRNFFYPQMRWMFSGIRLCAQ